MDESPFLQSSHLSEHKRRKSWLAQQCQGYSLSAMAIVFGVGIVLLGFLVVLIGVLVNGALVSVAPSNLLKGEYIVYSCLALWLLLALWLWISLVLIAKQNRAERVSDGDLLALQGLFFLVILGQALFASGADLGTLHEVSLAFEWIIIGFHILYFLLALCVWVRLPLRSYAAFVLMLALAICQTLFLA